MIAVASYFYISSKRYISTDNAYIKADFIELSSEVNGKIKEIYVNNNQYVQINDRAR